MKNREQIIAILTRLRRHHTTDRAERLAQALRRSMDDPFKPWTNKGSLRINPLLALVAVMASRQETHSCSAVSFSHDLR